MDEIELRDFAADAVKGDDTSKGVNGCIGYLDKFWSKYVRLTIDHEPCRDHFALERTFLSYVRTASAYAHFGVTIAQLFRLNTSRAGTSTSSSLRVGKAMGATIEGFAILIILMGAAYCLKQQRCLTKGAIVARGYEITTLVVLSFVMLCIILVLLATVDKW